VLEIIDTFPAFLKYWRKVRGQSINKQIEGWEKEYMSSWPELLAKQIDNYEADKLDWRQIARKRVFPHLAARMLPLRKLTKTCWNPACLSMKEYSVLLISTVT
jgi:hypothetical protein